MAKTTKKKNRKLRRQIRKTVGALFMASAIVVAALPVQEMQASPTDPAYNDFPGWVRCLNYTSNISAGTPTWETCPGSGNAAIEDWKSSVPLVDQDIEKYPIYTTSTTNNTVPYRFAFVPSAPGSGTNVAVILGTEKQKISNNTLTIDPTVDAYKKYSFNTSNTNYCAVSRDDSYLYYPAKSQRKVGIDGYWKVTNNEYQPSNRDSVYGDIVDGYQYQKEENAADKKTDGAAASAGENSSYRKVVEIMKTDNSVEPSIKILDVTITTYSVEAYEEQVTNEDGSTATVTKYRWKENVDNNVYQLEMSTVDSMQPCYDSTESVWGELGDDGLYYYTGTDANPDLTDITAFKSCGENTPEKVKKQRIHDVDVWYIGQQYVESTEEGVWEIKGKVTGADPSRGIFSNLTNVTTLNLPETLRGIGDYAFYGCQIEKVKFAEDGEITTIGNYAFANCISLSEVDIPLYSYVTVIGEGAFWGDYSLASFTAPTSLHAIGDFAFSGCSALQIVDLTSKGKPNYLDAIGFHAFENCSALTSIEFPEKFMQHSSGLPSALKNKIPINTFQGCTKLNHFTFNNNVLDIVDGYDYDLDKGELDNHKNDKNDITKPSKNRDCDIDTFVGKLSDPAGFYIEGVASSGWEAYQTAKAHCIAYKHLKEEIYEVWVECSEETKHMNAFTVNGDGKITSMTLDKDCHELVIPEKIGKIGITELSSASFMNKCNLWKVTIPQSVKLIGSGAFQGCHNLKFVIFSQPNNSDLVIENGAFATQQIPSASHMTGCDKAMDSEPFLSFTGDISDSSGKLSEPFAYAMRQANNIDNGSTQEKDSYITFYSGWPTNLTVKYNPESGENELVDYPRYEELENYTVFDLNTADRNSLPYVTKEYADAAKTAVEAVQNYESGSSNTRPTQDQYDIVNAALNMNLPAGITAIADGIFSGVDSKNQQAYEIVWDKKADTGEWSKVERELAVNKRVETITMNTVKTIDPYTFSQCEALTGFYMAGGNEIGDYAFKDCTGLENVEVAGSVSELGNRPFVGCSKLTDVKFKDNSPYFTCNDSIIYGLSNGMKDTIVECLEARGLVSGSAQVGPDELAGVTSVRPEAFKNCDGIGTVDLSSSSITNVPEQCFVQTDRLSNVTLPDTTRSIDTGAFWNSNIFWVKVPDSVTYIEPEAFATVAEDTDGEIELDEKGNPTILNETSGNSTITMVCAAGSAAETFADRYYYINPSEYVPEVYYTVYFWDDYEDSENPKLIGKQSVLEGEDAVPPTDVPEHSGVVFTGWRGNYKNISYDTDIYAKYGSETYEVKFLNYNGQQIGETQYISHGMNAVPPTDPVIEGATFKGWDPDYRGITGNTTCVAQFDWGTESNLHTVTFYSHDGTKVIADMKVLHGGTVYPPSAPARDGYTFIGWVPAGGFSNITSDKNFTASYDRTSKDGDKDDDDDDDKKKDSSASPSASPAASPSVTKYTVSVSGGSGSGSYAAGDIVAVNAYFMGEGQSFDKWTTSTAGVGFANPGASSTTFTMPAANVAVTATYKTGSGTAGTGSSGGGGTGVTPANTGSGTTVQVSKPGISNTGLAGATVSGATDNFIVKVTEQQSATDAAVAALQARYGSLDRIKYFPMDISLYDSTGRIKIADTSGISVNITLPLPDDQVQYAGNNRIAAVANGSLEDLNAKFTTVDGVPCINFTASHFSPYVIYVDTANLTAGTIDSTPKTGDPIHPKWFLAIGMACISLILFFKKDKAVVRPGRA